MRRSMAIVLSCFLATTQTNLSQAQESIGGALVAAATPTSVPIVSPDGLGGTTVTWIENYNGSLVGIAQRIGIDGQPKWPSPGVVFWSGTGYSAIETCTDGNGGVIAAVLTSGTLPKVTLHRVDVTGRVRWGRAGILVSDPTLSGSGSVRLAPDHKGGATAVWLHGGTGLRAQYVDSVGFLRWPSPGTPVSGATPSNQASPTVASDGLGGVLIAWHEWANPALVAALRIDSTGAMPWGAIGIPLASSPYPQTNAVIAADGTGGAIVAWRDSRPGASNIYAQRVTAGPVLEWSPAGTPVASAPTATEIAKLVPSDGGSSTLLWYDTWGGHIDILAQRISSTGIPEWELGGRQVVLTSVSKSGLVATADGSGGAIVAFRQYVSGSHPLNGLFAQRLTVGGVRQWGDAGVKYSTHGAGGTIAALGPSGYMMAFSNSILGGLGVFSQRISTDGDLVLRDFAAPTLTAVKDVAHDEGGHVRLEWSASGADLAPFYKIVDYCVWRSVPASQAQATERLAAAALLASPGNVYLIDGYPWEFVTSLPAGHLPSYSYVATTTTDSTATGNPRTAFMVQARTTSGTAWWFSNPDSGHSVDNIAPSAPSGLTATFLTGSMRLRWLVNQEPDFWRFEVHRSGVPGFEPSPSTLIGTTSDAAFDHATEASGHYKVLAVDVHGNASQPATVFGSGTVDVPASGIIDLALDSPRPHPVVGGRMTVALSLPSATPASLEMVDVLGRCVIRRDVGRLGAGRHSVEISPERGLAPGVYFLRLLQSDRRLSIRVVVLE